MKKGGGVTLSQSDAQAFMEQAQKTFLQLRAKQVELQKQLSQTRAQIGGAERERKRAELTGQELKELPSSVRTFTAVGRMFMLSDREDLKRSLAKQAETLAADLSALNKKREYLERQLTDAARQMSELRAALPS